MEMEQINPDENKKFIPIKTLVIYSLIFYLFWAVFNFFAKPFLAENMSDVWAAFIEDGIVKNLAWTLPAVLLLKKYRGSFFVELPKLYKPNKECIKYLWVYPAAMLVLLLKPAINGGIKIADSFGLGYIIIVLFVGMTEETVFRGFLLNSTYERHNEVSIAVNAVMFLLIHFPIWIYSGQFAGNITSGGFITIILLSVFFSLLFFKTKSLFIPITLHMLWDLLIFMFFEQA
ncbi:MAG: CPBP family intramembrane metalloprotease [Clostridia bacterium]|nr:CPBP family intramembrane metalloprotease [Clostridia bacterium]